MSGWKDNITFILIASYILRSHGKKIRISQKTLLVGDVRRRVRAKRSRIYDDAVLEVLKKVWYIMDCICGKRLAPVLNEVVVSHHLGADRLNIESTRGAKEIIDKHGDEPKCPYSHSSVLVERSGSAER